ncbi:MAG TPA: hypothetical protein VI389_06245 [Geobacteraceae bacterium]
MDELPHTSLVLTMKADRLGEFFLLLQQGVTLTAYVGCSLEKLLVEQWSLPRDYVATRITTIFLNGRAIDDVATAVVRDGAAVALSGAMPGLVGATMRRGGFYAAMRGAMTHHETEEGGSDRRGSVRLKLFNLLLPELGPGFLERGVTLGAPQAAAFLRERDESFWAGCEAVILDAAPLSPERLREGDAFPPEGTVRLAVIVRG